MENRGVPKKVNDCILSSSSFNAEPKATAWWKKAVAFGSALQK